MESVAGGSTIKARFRTLSGQWLVVSDQHLVTMAAPRRSDPFTTNHFAGSFTVTI
jgi:hypothetical protein